MNVSQASKIWLDYHRVHSKINTVRAYEWTIEPTHKLKIDQKKLQNCKSNILNLVNVL